MTVIETKQLFVILSDIYNVWMPFKIVSFVRQW